MYMFCEMNETSISLVIAGFMYIKINCSTELYFCYVSVDETKWKTTP